MINVTGNVNSGKHVRKRARPIYSPIPEYSWRDSDDSRLSKFQPKIPDDI